MAIKLKGLNFSILALACGSNSHFNACSRDCPETCSVLDAVEDCGKCHERCDCDDGFWLSGGRCVPVEDCGCWLDGQYYEVNMEKHQELELSTQIPHME